MLVNKFPTVIVSQGVIDKPWELDELMKIIEEEIKARERLSGNSTKVNKIPVRVHCTSTY